MVRYLLGCNLQFKPLDVPKYHTIHVWAYDITSRYELFKHIVCCITVCRQKQLECVFVAFHRNSIIFGQTPIMNRFTVLNLENPFNINTVSYCT